VPSDDQRGRNQDIFTALLAPGFPRNLSLLFFGLKCQRMAGGIRLIQSAMQFL
jgi:hypothetical protein